MKLVERYLLGSFLKVFSVLVFGISLLISVIRLVQVYPEISEYKPGFYKIGLYLIYSLPNYGGYILPMLGLLGVIFSLGQASRSRELLAISMAGGRPLEILKFLVFAGIGITVAGFIFMNILMPESRRLSRLVMEDITHEKQPERPFFTGEETWFRSHESIVRIGLYEAKNSQATDIGIYTLKDGKLTKRIEARSGLLKQDQWELRDVTMYEIETGRVVHQDTYYMGSSKYSLRLLRAGTLPEEMDSSRLWRYLMALKKSGLKNIKLTADFNLRLSLPLGGISMVLMGIYLGVSRKLPGLAMAGIGIGISIFFWFSTTFMMSLGYSGVLSPWIAPWVTPILSLIAGIFLYRRIE